MEEDVTKKASNEDAWWPRSYKEQKIRRNHMGLRGRLGRKIQEKRLERVLKKSKRSAEQAREARIDIAQENTRIAQLKEKQSLQKLKSERRELEAKTGTGLVGGFKKIGRATRPKLRSVQRRVSPALKRRPSTSKMALRQRKAALSVIGRGRKKRKKKPARKRIAPSQVRFF